MSDVSAGEVRTWIQKHERIVALALILAIGGWLGNRWITYVSDRDRAIASASAQQLQDQKNQNAKLEKQANDSAEQYKATIQLLNDQNNKLLTAIAQRNAQLKSQQDKDKTMPLPDVAFRWRSLAALPDGSITPATNGVTVTESAARQTVSELERIPVLEQNVQDEQKIVGNKQTELDKADKNIADLNQQVGGLKTQITDEQKTCKETIDTIKADARKSKRNWFLTGLAIGASVVAHFLK